MGLKNWMGRLASSFSASAPKVKPNAAEILVRSLEPPRETEYEDYTPDVVARRLQALAGMNP